MGPRLRAREALIPTWLMKLGLATMKTYSKGIWLAAAVAVAGLTVSACATEAYVDEHLAAMNTKVESVDSHVNDVSGQVAAVNTRVASVDSKAQAARGRADSAYSLAEGK